MPGPSQRRPSIFAYDWRHPLTWISAIAFVGAIVAIIVASFVPGSGSIAFLSNVLTLIASSLISHLITYSNERKQFARHLAKFSAFAKRRVDILCTDLNLLSIEIKRTPDLLESKRIVQYALNNLEQDARASVQDIDDMRRIDEEDDNSTTDQVASATTQQLTSNPATLESTLQSAIPDEKVIYSCPSCDYSNTAVLATSPGSTQHVECANCRTRLILHRLAKGTYRVVNPAKPRRKFSPNKALPVETSRSEPASPESSFHIPGEAPLGQRGGSRIHESFLCPRCKHRIGFTASPDQRVVEKPCFSCLSVVSYDRRDGIATDIVEKKPIYLASLDSTRQMKCVTCHKEFVPRILKAEDGKELICCFSCNTIYLPNIYKKTSIEKECPSSGCANTVTFKIHEKDGETKQFCLECMSRLLYNRATDHVSVLEKLTVPQIAYEDFDSGGRLCPHCHNSASGRHVMNSRKQKLSICWNCKNVFELVYKASVVPLRRTDG